MAGNQHQYSSIVNSHRDNLPQKVGASKTNRVMQLNP